jgi:hypothetical protein
MGLIDLGTNFDDAVKDSEFPVLDPGVYDFRISDYELKPNSNGDEMLVIKHEVINCDNPDWNGVKLLNNITLPVGNEKKGLPFLTQLVKGVGQTWEGSSFNPENLLGAEGQMLLENKEYQGKPQTRIKRVIQPAE